MRLTRIVFSLVLLAGVASSFAQASTKDRASLDRYIYPLSSAIKCPPVVVDASDLPEAAPWGDAAKKLVETWFSTICQMLATEKYRVPHGIKLVIKKKVDAPAYTSGDEITINGEWITAHPNDLGMVIHELTHVIQQYEGDGPKPGWMIEGIADYVRWWRYEPSPPGPRFSQTATYHDSYRTTAAFLAWVSQHYDQRLVPTLDRALRTNKDPMPIFKELTGKTPEELWDEMVPRRAGG